MGRNPTYFGHNQAAAGGGGIAFSDNFNRADSSSLGSNWAKTSTGDAVINSNQLIFVDGSWGGNMILFVPSVGLTTQYQKATLLFAAGAAYVAMLFRAVSASAAGYSIVFDKSSDNVAWWYFPNLSSNSGSVEITSASMPGGIGSGDIMGVTVDGFGTNTTIRIWRNPTGLALAAANWNGDTTPDVTFTTNPPTAADIGVKLGLFGASLNDYESGFDNWFGGSL